jgi:hypothetical protein
LADHCFSDEENSQREQAMKNAATVRDVTLVASLTAIAVTAFATNGAMSEPTWIPSPVAADTATPATQGQDEVFVTLKWSPSLSGVTGRTI